MADAPKTAKRADNKPKSGGAKFEGGVEMQRVLVYEHRITTKGGLGLRKRFEWRPKRTT